MGFEIYYYVFSFLELFWQPIGRLMVLFSFFLFLKVEIFLLGKLILEIELVFQEQRVDIRDVDNGDL